MECKQYDKIRFTSGYFQHSGIVDDRVDDLVWVTSDEGEQFLILVKHVLEVVG